MIKRSVIIVLLLIGPIASVAQDLKLFSSEMRNAASYPHLVIMNFLERYFGKELPAVRHTKLDQKMADDKVFIRKGKLKDLYQVSDTMTFTIEKIGKFYEVSWNPLVTIVFPVQYDLLLGIDKDKALEQLKDTIISAPRRKVLETFPPTDTNQVSDGIWLYKTSFLEIESLNDAKYYCKKNDEFIPVFDSNYLECSAANLFQGLIMDADYKMYVEQSLYGMKTANYTITLQQWLNYCDLLNLKVFFGVEEQREDGLLAIVIAQSQELGFNHVLSVIIPDKFVTSNDAVFKIRFTPYVPATNVKELYKQETQKRKKRI